MIISYIVPEIWCVMDVIVIFYFGLFLPFYPLTAPKIKNFKKMRKRPGDLIILHKCTKNYDYRVYCSWDNAHDRCNCYFLFWAIFLPFYPSNLTQKWKFQKNENKYLEISSIYKNVPKIMIMCYTVPEIWHMTNVIVIFHFGLFFTLLPP